MFTTRRRARCAALAVFAFVLTLSAPDAARAQEQQRQPWEDQMEKAVKARWLGKSESAVTERLGPPADRRAQDKNVYATWQNEVGFGSGREFSCKALMSFESDKLTKVEIFGDDQNLCAKLLHPLLSDPDKHS